MKKVSTAARKQTNNFGEQKLTIGLDLGDRSSWYCMLDGSGAVLLEQKLGTTPKAMQEGFGDMPRSRIALETGMHSLGAAGTFVVRNPDQPSQIACRVYFGNCRLRPRW